MSDPNTEEGCIEIFVEEVGKIIVSDEIEIIAAIAAIIPTKASDISSIIPTI